MEKTVQPCAKSGQAADSDITLQMDTILGILTSVKLRIVLVFFVGAITGSSFSSCSLMSLPKSGSSNEVELRVRHVSVSFASEVWCGKTSIEHWNTWLFQADPRFRAAAEGLIELRTKPIPMGNLAEMQISQQPGKNTVWLGYFLVLAALIYSLNLSHQRKWAAHFLGALPERGFLSSIIIPFS